MPSVEERQTKTGTRFVVRVRDPDPPRGKSGYTSATFATKPEARRFVRDVEDRGVAWALAEYRRSKDEASELRLDEWAEIHFDALTKPAPATVARYRRIYRQWWSPELGHMRLSQIERVHVAAALNKVTGSDKTIRNAWGVLTHMLKMALLDRKIDRLPTEGVSTPRRGDHLREEHRYLTPAEFLAVIAATPPHWQPLVMMLGGTGMRWGEAAALTVGDIDLEQGLVRITKAEKQDPDHPGKTIVGPTKTKMSRRVVTLPAEVVAAIQPLTLGRKRNERLFLPPNGGPLRHRTFYRDIWLKKSCATSGIKEPYPRLHDLRHSQAAWQIAQGTPPSVVQARLGHEDITTTLGTYGHLMPETQEKARQAAAAVFAGLDFGGVLALPQRSE